MIREAVREDIAELVEMGRAYHERLDAPGAYIPADFGNWLHSVIDRPDYAVLRGKKGFLVGFIAASPYNRSLRTAHQQFWYSSGGDGIALLKAFEAWAQAQGACSAHIGFPGRMVRVFGYRPLEVQHAKVL